MTLTALNYIAKAKKINLDHYTKVVAFANEAYTYITVKFFDEQGTGFDRMRCDEKVVKLSVMSILKRDEDTDDYETRNGCPQWLWQIK